MPGMDDDDATRPPPHPLDRTWLHPSELFAATRPFDTDAPSVTVRRAWRRDALLAVAAGTIGAIAAVAVLGVLGAFDREHLKTVTPPPPAGFADAAQIGAQVIPGVAAVISTVDGAERRGSGVAVGAHQILTTAGVIEGMSGTGTGIEVCVANGRRHAATVTGRDAATGLVLLTVPTLRVEPAPLATTRELRAGDWVAAVGRNSASGPWVTSGVVTATGGWSTDPSGGLHAGMITTNTTLADEARGGALVNRHGQVVGILAISGAATPVDMASTVATQLVKQGWASHGALGVRATDTRAAGASVVDVTAGSSADKAGLRVGDQIVGLDDGRIPDSATLVYELRRRPAGQRVRLTLVREKHTLVVDAGLDTASGTEVVAGR